MGNPLYITIQNYIKEKIASKQWEAGAMLPTEKEFSKMFGVSRITVTTALRELVKDGIIYRIQGKGTFVAPTSPVVDQTVSKDQYEAVESMQVPGEHRCLSISRCHPSPHVAKLLNIQEKQVIIAIDRVKYVEGKPSFVERFFLPASYYLEATDEQLGALHMSELAKVCEIPLGKNIVSTEAIMADAELVDLLQLDDQQPILHTTLEIFNQQNEAVAYIEVFNTDKQKQIFVGGDIGL